MKRIADDIYAQTLADCDALLAEPPDRRPMYRSENQYDAIEFETSDLEEDVKVELREHGFEPVVLIQAEVHYTHPMLADVPEQLETEYWSLDEGIVAQLGLDPVQRYLTVIFSDATMFSIWPDLGSSAMYPNPNRELVASSGSLEDDLATMRDVITSREEGVRPLRVVDLETARRYDEVHAAYLVTELPEVYEKFFDSTSKVMESGRRQNIIIAIGCIAVPALLGYFFDSWLVFGAALIVSGLILWLAHHWIKGMSDDVIRTIRGHDDY